MNHRLISKLIQSMLFHIQIRRTCNTFFMHSLQTSTHFWDKSFLLYRTQQFEKHADKWQNDVTLCKIHTPIAVINKNRFRLNQLFLLVTNNYWSDAYIFDLPSTLKTVNVFKKNNKHPVYELFCVGNNNHNEIF